MFKAPVLLITFNRPHYVSMMIEALRKAQIPKLYVFKDGPRPNNIMDLEASKEIELIISNIDWECEIITNYLQNNLGCGYGPFSAISWVFQYEKELIILEDDCIPSVSFFEFCNKLIPFYREDKRIRLISGRSQMSQNRVFKEYDYIFTQYAPTWGWATWKRVWDNFDMQMRELKDFFTDGGFTDQFSSKKEANFFNKRYYKLLKDPSAVFHIWDYQFGLHCRKDGALGIVPKFNLIEYIGIEGTHPVNSNSEYAKLSSVEDFTAKSYPNTISIIPSYDYAYFVHFIKSQNIFILIFKKLKTILKKI